MLNPNLSAALAAKEFARRHIIQGSTQLETNQLPIAEQIKIYAEIKRMRQQIKNLASQSLLGLPQLLNYYYNIQLTLQSHLGNCHELAVMALKYILDNEPKIDAEIFRIKGGDHVFLVVGRDKNSNLSDPLSWGENAYFCDPWADKVYPAKAYKSQLSNYEGVTRTTQDGCYLQNAVFPLNESLHSLEPISYYSTSYIRKYSEPQEFKLVADLYLSKSKALLGAIAELKTAFENVNTYLLNRYGASNQKSVELNSYIGNLATMEAQLQALLTLHQDIENHTLYQLDQKMQQGASQLGTLLSDHHQSKCAKTLKIYNDPYSFSALLHWLFFIPPKSSRTTSKAIQNTESKLIDIILR
jgi:hypothetical protein